MKDSELQRLIRLARKTGDTLVIADPSGEQSIVLMPVERYEAMVDMQDVLEESLLDESFEGDFVESESDVDEAFDGYEGGVEDFDDEVLPVDLEEEVVPAGLPMADLEEAPTPAAPTRIEPIGQTEAAPVNEEFESEEERFYLEPVE